jgi:hypothetical protein
MTDSVPDHIPMHSGGAALPEGAAIRVEFQAFLDCDPDEFPQGMELILMRPGQLDPVGRGLMVPRGCILYIAGPEASVHLRAGIRKQIEAQRKLMANGNLGRRSR